MRARRKNPHAFTTQELITVIGIILVLFVLLGSLLSAAREKANRVKCSRNLRSLGQALILYANENGGHMPRTTHAPGPTVIPVAGTGTSAPNPFGPDGPAPNDVSASIFLLLRTQEIGSEVFLCPSVRDMSERDRFGGSGRTALNRSNFSDYRKHLGYSFANPYPDEAAAETGYELNSSHLVPTFATAADLNPGPRAAPTANSPNHRRRGQNVLFGDGHVEWKETPLAGINKDNIYRNKRNQVMASPADKDDSVLLPANH